MATTLPEAAIVPVLILFARKIANVPSTSIVPVIAKVSFDPLNSTFAKDMLPELMVTVVPVSGVNITVLVPATTVPVT